MRRSFLGLLLLASSFAVATGQVSSSRPRLRQPVGLCSLPTGRLVALEAAGRTVVISTSGIVERPFDFGTFYQSLEIAAGVVDGRELLMVSMVNKASVAEFSRLALLRDGKPTYLPLPGRGWYAGLAFDSATKTLYLSNTDVAQIVKVDLGAVAPTTSYVLSIPGKVIGPLALDSSGKRLFAADVARGTIYVASLTDRKVQALPAARGLPASLAFDPATDRLYVADAAGDRIWLYDLRLPTSPPRLFAARNGLSEPRGIAVDSAGNVWVANKGSGFLLSFDRNGKLLTIF